VVIIVYDPWKIRLDFARILNIREKRVLDVGTGRGYMAIVLARDYNCIVASIDVNDQKLQTAAKLAGEHGVSEMIAFTQEDITTKTSFGNHGFDLVVALNTLHHMTEDQKVKCIEEMARLARDAIVIGELNEKGARYFDEVAHPSENHEGLRVPVDWFEKYLGLKGLLEVIEGELINVYTCRL